MTNIHEGLETKMSDSETITQWLSKICDGDEQAAQVIWEQYFEKLIRLAHYNAVDLPLREADEEDMVLSAMNSFLRGAAASRFPQLDDRHDLWKVLMTITLRKVSKQRKRHFAEKRGGGQVRGESVFIGHGKNTGEGFGIDQILGEEPTPELAAEVAETSSELLDRLGDEDLKKIALLKLEGYSNSEIASQLEISERSVERKLSRIRSKWEPVGVVE